jgi:hypothetical protein
MNGSLASGFFVEKRGIHMTGSANAFFTNIHEHFPFHSAPEESQKKWNRRNQEGGRYTYQKRLPIFSMALPRAVSYYKRRLM